jgi:hypothetical protein
MHQRSVAESKDSDLRGYKNLDLEVGVQEPIRTHRNKSKKRNKETRMKRGGKMPQMQAVAWAKLPPTLTDKERKPRLPELTTLFFNSLSSWRTKIMEGVFKF